MSLANGVPDLGIGGAFHPASTPPFLRGEVLLQSAWFRRESVIDQTGVSGNKLLGQPARILR
jgi:hypothetical protein